MHLFSASLYFVLVSHHNTGHPHQSYYLPSTRTIHNTHYHGVVTQLASVLLSTTLFYYSNANIYIITNKPQISSYKGRDNGQWTQSIITFVFKIPSNTSSEQKYEKILEVVKKRSSQNIFLFSPPTFLSVCNKTGNILCALKLILCKMRMLFNFYEFSIFYEFIYLNTIIHLSLHAV